MKYKAKEMLLEGLREEYTYVKSTPELASYSIFKVGENPIKKSILQVLPVEVSLVKEEELTILRTIKSFNLRLVELNLYGHLEACDHENAWFRVPYDWLMEVVDQVEQDEENRQHDQLKRVNAMVDSICDSSDDIFVKIGPMRICIYDSIFDLSDSRKWDLKETQTKLLELVSAFITLAYKLDPPAQHMVRRQDKRTYDVPLPVFREWLLQNAFLLPPRVRNFNAWVYKCVTEQHKQAVPHAKRPPYSWNQSLEVNCLIASSKALPKVLKGKG